MRMARSTGARTPCSDRQPSSSTSASSLRSVMTGLTSAAISASSSPVSKTNRRCKIPSCVAARPTPLASTISSRIRSTRWRSSSSNVSTGLAAIRRAGSGYWRICAGAALRALGGPLAWMRRLRTIELLIAEHEARLQESWNELRAAHEDDREFAASWRALADAWSFEDVNDLIERHNRYYPIETRLPMSPRTGDFVPVNGRPYTREPLDAAWILARFPPSA